MNPERWRVVTSLFDKAIGLPPLHRDAFLISACGTDADLLAELRSLLDVHTEDPEYLEANVWSDHGEAIEDAIENQNLEERVGNYRLVRKIGSGGMGSVYLAERDDDEFRKQVAIKFIRTGAMRETAVKRFRRERQILARLEHPGIARLLDGGTTSRGTPYFIMEYVEGKPILDYCDEQGMGIRARLELFLKICEAVEYAHERLIVHRDLKASNILVDKTGQPKLLDFGIAKVLAPDEAGQLTLTQTGMRQFTPDYASPEQIRGDQVTTATDVYSLGVLLYEMLTGRRPLHFHSYAPTEILNVLLESQPVRPSAAVSRIEEIGGKTVRPELVAWNRRTETRALARALSGDLDNIVLKSLAKRPEDRYGTAMALALDLRAHLDGNIVSAQRATPSYRAAKFLRRNAWQAAVGAALVVLLVGGVITAAWQWKIARDERIRAELFAQNSREIARSLIIDLHQALLKIPGTTDARELLLHRSSSFVDSLAAASRGDRALQLELAETYRKIAQAWRHAAAEAPNNRREAIENQTKGLKLARAALQDRGYRSQAAAVTIRLLTNYRDTLREAGDLEAAKAASAELTRLRAEVNSEEADASRR